MLRVNIRSALSELRSRRLAIDEAIAALERISVSPRDISRPKTRNRVMTPEARAKIAAATKRRWAAAKRAGKATLG